VVRTLGSRISKDNLNAVFLAVLGAYVIFSLLDVITTAVALASGGREGNPIAASVYSQYGAVGLFGFKVLIVGVIIAALVFVPRKVMSKRVAVWAATVFTLATAVAVVGNLHALQGLANPGDLHQVLPANVRFV
jgi:threonine/homoserine efflux transporter RhtA